ncbi:MAG TPA: hypothetical protein VLY21_07235 [Nitrososphaerales archaeon]|nr:hypothetical protein [Nitrososphaerales archaeon]
MSKKEIDDSVLEEGCYYLARLGLSVTQIAKNLNITEARARALSKSYSSKLKSGTVVPDPFDRTFWEDVRKEAEGDSKVTFVSEKGIHHSWVSDLRRLDGAALMSIYEASQDFLNADPNQRFLEYAPPSGYDPLALEREVKKAVSVVEGLIKEKGGEK